MFRTRVYEAPDMPEAPEPPHAAAAPEPQPLQPVQPVQPLRVLIVEDDANTREATRELLELLDAKVLAVQMLVNVPPPLSVTHRLGPQEFHLRAGSESPL